MVLLQITIKLQSNCVHVVTILFIIQMLFLTAIAKSRLPVCVCMYPYLTICLPRTCLPLKFQQRQAALNVATPRPECSRRLHHWPRLPALRFLGKSSHHNRRAGGLALLAQGKWLLRLLWLDRRFPYSFWEISYASMVSRPTWRHIFLG